jgi:hypothetical protein
VIEDLLELWNPGEDVVPRVTFLLKHFLDLPVYEAVKICRKVCRDRDIPPGDKTSHTGVIQEMLSMSHNLSFSVVKIKSGRVDE